MANKPLKSIKFPGLNDTYTIPQVDSTLAVSGAAADAKKTGDAIGDLKSAFEQTMQNGYVTVSDFVQGQRLNPWVTPNAGVTTRCTSKDRFYLNEGDQITISDIDSALHASIQGIVNNAFVYDSSWKTGSFSYTIPSGRAGYYYVTVGNLTNTNIVPSDISTLHIDLTTAKFLYTLKNDLSALNQLAVKGTGVVLSSAAQFVAPYDDCNTLVNNSIVTIFENPIGKMANVPSDFNGGTIITMDASPNDTLGSCQLAIRRDGNLYSRHKFSTWGPWIKYINDAFNVYAEMAMFPTFAVVGDSFASGGIYKDNISGAFYPYSWPVVLSRILGNTVKNYSAPGLSTRTWLTNAGGLAAAMADNPSALYLLCLGINDGSIYNSDNSYLGSIADIKSDYTQNPDTFYGNYGRIIAQLMAHAPGAKFVLIANPTYDKTSTTWQLFQTSMAEIATHFSIPYIAGHDNAYFDSGFFQNNKASGHPLAITYGGMAKAYKEQIEKTIQLNPSYFADVH